MRPKKTFKAVVEEGQKGSAHIALPFDPDAVWGTKPRHRLSGTIDGEKIRVIIGPDDREVGIRLTPMWRRDAKVEAGRRVSVVLWAEGPQQGDLADDFLAALKAEPKALAFFNDLAQFYRKAWLTWIDGTKKKPEERVRRIRETVKLLKAGKKERPK
ncbi:MAG: YdeI/OmpD-associated family protein [Hyphomonadaceae bacterium]|nr:YdeI/OmpD-associated family protein [Hyphomonadaceae bacterium]